MTYSDDMFQTIEGYSYLPNGVHGTDEVRVVSHFIAKVIPMNVYSEMLNAEILIPQ